MTVPVTSITERPRRRLGDIDKLRELLPLPRTSLYEMARGGRLPGVVRVGARVLFDLDAIDEWIAAGGGRPSK